MSQPQLITPETKEKLLAAIDQFPLDSEQKAFITKGIDDLSEEDAKNRLTKLEEAIKSITEFAEAYDKSKAED